jgi:hypothetical protein
MKLFNVNANLTLLSMVLSTAAFAQSSYASPQAAPQTLAEECEEYSDWGWLNWLNWDKETDTFWDNYDEHEFLGIGGGYSWEEKNKSGKVVKWTPPRRALLRRARRVICEIRNLYSTHEKALGTIMALDAVKVAHEQPSDAEKKDLKASMKTVSEAYKKTQDLVNSEITAISKALEAGHLSPKGQEIVASVKDAALKVGLRQKAFQDAERARMTCAATSKDCSREQQAYEYASKQYGAFQEWFGKMKAYANSHFKGKNEEPLATYGAKPMNVALEEDIYKLIHSVNPSYRGDVNALLFEYVTGEFTRSSSELSSHITALTSALDGKPPVAPVAKPAKKRSKKTEVVEDEENSFSADGVLIERGVGFDDAGSDADAAPENSDF